MDTTATPRIPVKGIVVTRAEGPIGECGIPHAAATYGQANQILARMARTAPRSGGYDKVDFEITFDDGKGYQGRYDLTAAPPWPDLAAHVREFAEFHAGRNLPPHLSAAERDAYLAYIKVDRAGWAEFADTYDLGYPIAPRGVVR